MKSIYDEKSHLLGTTTRVNHLSHHQAYGNPRESIMTGAILSAEFAAIVALSVVMLTGLYCWGRQAPVFRPDRGAVPAIEQTMPFSN